MNVTKQGSVYSTEIPVLCKSHYSAARPVRLRVELTGDGRAQPVKPAPAASAAAAPFATRQAQDLFEKPTR